MAGMRLEFAQFGHFDSFNIYRSLTPMDINNMPPPIASGISTMFYVDTEVDDYERHHYRIGVVRAGELLISDEVVSELNATVPSSDIPEDYILRYDFNGDSLDGSLNRLDGVMTGSIAFENGRKAGSLCLKFSNGCVRTPSVLPINSNKMTVSFWFKTTKKSGSNWMFELSDNSNSRPQSWRVFHGGTASEITSQVLSGNVSGSNALINSSGIWQHCLISIDKAYSAEVGHNIYINNEKTSVPAQNTLITGNFINYIMYIGQRNASQLPFDGSMQDIRIYNRLLTDAERTQLFEE